MRNKQILTLIIVCMLFNCKIAFANTEESSDSKIENPKILKEQALIFYRNNNYNDALRYFQSLDNATLNNNEVQLIIANCYESINKPDLELDHIKASILLNPESSYAYYNLGLYYFNNKNYDLSIKAFKNAIKYNITFSAAYYNLGTAYYIIGEYNKAAKYLTKAASLNSNDANIHYNLSLSYKALNKAKKAEKSLNQYKLLTRN